MVLALHEDDSAFSYGYDEGFTGPASYRRQMSRKKRLKEKEKWADELSCLGCEGRLFWAQILNLYL